VPAEGQPSPALGPALRECASGELPPTVALMQLLIESASPRDAEAALSDAAARLRADGEHAPAERLGAALQLLERHPGAFEVIKSILAGVEHHASAGGRAETIARWASVFDRAARISPEASVALYSLGQPSLLRAATQELVARLRDWQRLGPDCTVLDIGCGIGRLEEAVAGEVGTIIGLDVSREMILQARRRCGGLPNVRLEVSSGQDLGMVHDEAIDTVIAVDSFPYLVQAGLDLVECHFAEAARVLKPAGSLVILSFSYRHDPELDRREVSRLGARHGFTVKRNGTRELTLWDGLTFELERVPA
jgi:ubiquinone/menaquinone biosynthesis C-methylase UbiE